MEPLSCMHAGLHRPERCGLGWRKSGRRARVIDRKRAKIGPKRRQPLLMLSVYKANALRGEQMQRELLDAKRRVRDQSIYKR